MTQTELIAAVIALLDGAFGKPPQAVVSPYCIASSVNTLHLNEK
jgi:hypothetical protein